MRKALNQQTFLGVLYIFIRSPSPRREAISIKTPVTPKEVRHLLVPSGDGVVNWCESANVGRQNVRVGPCDQKFRHFDETSVVRTRKGVNISE